MTERTAAETERPGEGKTLGEVAKEAHMAAKVAYVIKNPYGSLDAREAHAWQATAEAVKAALIPCTFPSCLSAQTAASAGEEIARLKGENAALLGALQVVDGQRQRWWGKAVSRRRDISALTADIAALKAELSNLIAATKGQTFFHSDEAVNAEMGRLRGEVDRTKCALENSMAAHKALATDALLALAGKVCTPEEGYVKATHCLRRDIEELEEAAYQRGVEEERVRCAEIAMQATAAYQDSDIPKAIADAIRAASLAPQKNTAECQEVCEWRRSSPVAITAGCNTTGGNDAYAIGFKFCPYCGKPIKVDNG